MAGPQSDHRVVIDPALELARPLARLLPTLNIVEDISDYVAAPVAVLSIPSARACLAGPPPSTTVIVIAHRHDRDQALHLYAIGAGMVIIDPPIEEVAARIRAVVRHVRQLQA